MGHPQSTHPRSTPHTLRVWKGQVGRSLCPAVCTMGLRLAIAKWLWLLFKWQSHGPLVPFFQLYGKQKEMFLFLIERRARGHRNDSLSLWDDRCLGHKADRYRVCRMKPRYYGMAYGVCRMKPRNYGRTSPLQSYLSFAVPRTVQDKNQIDLKQDHRNNTLVLRSAPRP